MKKVFILYEGLCCARKKKQSWVYHLNICDRSKKTTNKLSSIFLWTFFHCSRKPIKLPQGVIFSSLKLSPKLCSRVSHMHFVSPHSSIFWAKSLIGCTWSNLILQVITSYRNLPLKGHWLARNYFILFYFFFSLVLLLACIGLQQATIATNFIDRNCWNLPDPNGSIQRCIWIDVFLSM